MGLIASLKTLFSGGKVDLRQRFELLREASAGTMSKCYKARDKKHDRVVALKILDPKKTEEFEARFKGLAKPPEGEIAVQLEHPLIVKTLEYGELTSGELFILMEYVDGIGLQALIRNQSPRLDGRRVMILKQAAEAIHAVHTAGFIHRDICPRNLITLPGDEHVPVEGVKLIDFGLTVPATKAFMMPGNRTGTPNYMAPEIVRRQRTDQRLDIFAFGVTAYETCTFQLPWRRGSTGQAAMYHATEDPVDIREYRPNLHPLLADAIMSCIEQNPEERCPTLPHFLKAIQQVEHEDA